MRTIMARISRPAPKKRAKVTYHTGAVSGSSAALTSTGSMTVGLLTTACGSAPELLPSSLEICRALHLQQNVLMIPLIASTVREHEKRKEEKEFTQHEPF